MEIRGQKHPYVQQPQASGSSENRGSGREEQRNPNIHLDRGQKHDIARDLWVKPDDVIDISDTGARSGRDDNSGGSGDRMEEESTGR